MRLSYTLLVATAALVATLDTASADTSAAMSKPNLSNGVDLANAHASIRNDRRFLRTHQVLEDEDDIDDSDDEDSEEARGFMDSAKALKVLGQLALARNADEMFPIISSVRDPGVLKALFTKGESKLAEMFPNFSSTMHLDDFMTMVQASRLSDDEQNVLISAYSKYWVTHVAN